MTLDNIFSSNNKYSIDNPPDMSQFSNDDVINLRQFAESYNMLRKATGMDSYEPNPVEDSPRPNLLKCMALCECNKEDNTKMVQLHLNDNKTSRSINTVLRESDYVNIMEYNGKSDKFPYAYFYEDEKKYTGSELVEKLLKEFPEFEALRHIN
jgi:hypothetical protein